MMLSRNKKGLVLEIPTKDRGNLDYHTSVDYMMKLIKGQVPAVYFNPRGDFDSSAS